ncbi:MAG: type II toxin-antitoxin system HicB family antitoxin [Thiotrichales bacterium]|jgi:predicted HicB family RNase H-like nuclease|nr:type II toxin-antitoxin system HicB family antitoxin [Thiotrichales bacterium]
MTYLHYKGYLGTIEPQLDDDTLYGKLAFIRDLVTYEAENLTQLKKEFEFSVDAYLNDCQELGREPNQPFKGSFNVRTTPELHRQAVLAAGEMSLNSFVSEAIKEKVERTLQAA